jgi:hypothetical protein
MKINTGKRPDCKNLTKNPSGRWEGPDPYIELGSIHGPRTLRSEVSITEAGGGGELPEIIADYRTRP